MTSWTIFETEGMTLNIGPQHPATHGTLRIIARLDDQKHVFFMDIGAKFLDERGFFLPDAFRTDNLHPQAKGYDIWGKAIKGDLEKLLK